MAQQYEINFAPGITEQFPVWGDVVRESVYGCGRAFKTIAADLDMSTSELSRKLADNPNDNVSFPQDRLDDLIAATGDKRPIYWLIEKFLDDGEKRKQRALSTVETLLPQLMAAVKNIKAA